MGAWGAGSFENDMACDWTAGLEDVADLSYIEETLTDVLEDDEEYLDSDPASAAIGACEVLARLKGHSAQCDPFTESVDAWVAAHPQPVPDKLIKLALKTLDRILAPDSELLELWDETGSRDWHNAVEDLRKRLLV